MRTIQDLHSHDKLSADLTSAVTGYITGLSQGNPKSNNHDFITTYLGVEEKHGVYKQRGNPRPVTQEQLKEAASLFVYNLIYKAPDWAKVQDGKIGDIGNEATGEYLALTLLEDIKGPQKVALARNAIMGVNPKPPAKATADMVILPSLSAAQKFMEDNQGLISKPTGLKLHSDRVLGRTLIDANHTQNWILKYPGDVPAEFKKLTPTQFTNSLSQGPEL